MDATTFTSDELAPADLAAALGRSGLEVSRSKKVRRTLLDSFDGRLHGAHLRLELREQSGLELVLSSAGGSPAARLDVAAAPRLSGDIPAGPFRSRLSGILDVRALLPVMKVTTRETTATRKDPAGKARVSIILHELVAVEDNEWVATTWTAEVDPLAGYAKDAEKARQLLRGLGLKTATADILDVAATNAGIDLRGFITSPTVALRGEEHALDAFRLVLANLASTVEANWQGTVNDVDPEFLHDLRVAVRRTRSVLAQGKLILPTDVRDTYRKAFGWLGTATGRTRDLDVYMIEWDGYVEPLGPAAGSALAPVHDHISQQRRTEHAVLVEMLRSPRYRNVMDGWYAWLNGLTTEGAGKDAGRPIGAVAAGRTARAHNDLLDRGRSIGPETAAEELHELRKDAKKLRYLLECFGGLYASGPRKAFVQRLKALQDNLGEHQDTEVHVSELRAISSDLHATPGVGPETLVAVGQLTEHLDRRRRAARHEFATRFAAYDTKQTQRNLDALLGSSGGNFQS